nr:AAA family ATPase [Jiangella gansuensis]
MHTFPDGPGDPDDIGDYIQAALARGVGILAITDHNTTKNVAAAIREADGTGLLVLPGIEITTHQGHLLALFGPGSLGVLEDFARPSNLSLEPDPLDASVRSSRSILHLVNEISERGGLAIPAHIDLAGGIVERMTRTELTQLLAHPGLSALEYSKTESLSWFTDADTDADRLAAWNARKANTKLADRGLARIMSSDAHTVAQLGVDKSRRTISRLRVDEPNFAAVVNAIVHNPKARCKVEAELPPTYPRVLAARFEGGFLDGVTVALSNNLNCFIGGRGSGKSTALLAIRAALGAQLGPDENPNDASRMPERTTVTFVDRIGNERTAVRVRGEDPFDEATGAPVSLMLADLAQDESGRLVRNYHQNPREILTFLDKFCELQGHHEKEAELLDLLKENATNVSETSTSVEQVRALEVELSQLEASLEAARSGKIEALVKYANILATESPLIETLDSQIKAHYSNTAAISRIDLDKLATTYGVDLTERPASDFIEGEGRLRQELNKFANDLKQATKIYNAAAQSAAKPSLDLLALWRKQHSEWKATHDQRRQELEQQGLKIQVGELDRIASRMGTVRTELAKLRERQKLHQARRRERSKLLQQLISERDRVHQRRQATLKRVVEIANNLAVGLTIEITFERNGVRDEWARWLSTNFGFRAPRVNRLAEAITPQDFAELLLTKGKLGPLLIEADGDRFFDGNAIDRVEAIFTWATIFQLQYMLLEDRPRIRVRQRNSADAQEFDHLSAGQQRSILLSLMLCADRLEPLILDQPEDHLDAGYIASAIVRHLEHAKERRQVILATHSPNLTVLGEAELVLPMYASGQHGSPKDSGAVDSPRTRPHVCDLLEGGDDAYRRRGERYGYQVSTVE